MMDSFRKINLFEKLKDLTNQMLSLTLELSEIEKIEIYSEEDLYKIMQLKEEIKNIEYQVDRLKNMITLDLKHSVN